MQISIRPEVLEKITKARRGKVVAEKLQEFSDRPNNQYTRGILHGYLLCLTTEGIITKDDAVEILDSVQQGA